MLPEPLGVEEIEYRSVLVAFEDGEPFSEEMVATAVKLASKRRRGIHVHSMLTVPTNLPLDAELPEQEAEAQSKIEQAKLIGGQRVTGHVERVRPGQAGYAIAEEAKLIKAAAIVVGLRYRNGAPLYDKTLQTVLGERPCRVIVVSDRGDPAGAERRPPAAGLSVRRPRIAAMASPERIYHGSVRAFSLVFVVLGLVILVADPRQRRRPALGRGRCSASPSSRSAPAGSGSPSRMGR